MFNDSLILKIEYDTRAAMRAVKDLQREADKLGDIDLKATAARKSNSGSGNTNSSNTGGSHGLGQAAAILSVGALLRRNLLSSFDPLIKSNQQLSNALSSLDKANQDKQTATATAAGTVEHDVKINLDALGFADTVAERLQRVSIELDAKEAKNILSEFGSAANREAIIAKEGLSKAIALELKAIKLAFSDTLKGLNKKQETAVSAVAAGTATPEQRDTFREVAAAFQDGLATFSGAVEDSKTGIVSATQNLESFADRTGGTFESTTNLFASAIEGNVVAERELASKVLQLDGSILGLTNASDKLAGKYKERGVAGNSLLADSRVMKHFGDQRDIIGGIGSKAQARFADSDPKLIAVFDKLRSLESKRETIANDPTASLSDIRSQTTELDKQIGRVNAVLRDELNYRSDRLAAFKEQEDRKARNDAAYAEILKKRDFDRPLRDIYGQKMAPQLGSSKPYGETAIVPSPGGALVLIKRIIDDLNDFSFVVGFATKQVSEMARAFALAQGTNRGTGKPITALPGWSPDLAKLPTQPIAGYAQLIESTTKLLKEASDGYALALYHSAREIQLAAQEMQPLAGIKGSVRGLVQAYRSFILGELAQIGRIDVFTSPDRAKQLQKGKTDLRLAAMSVQNEAKDVPGALARRGKTEVLKPVDNIAASAKELETLAVNIVTSGVKALAVTVLEMLREADAIARQETTRFAQRNQQTIDVRAETIVDGFSAPALRGETALRKLPYQALEVAASDDTALAIHRLGVSAIEVAQKLNVVSGLLAVKGLGHVDSLAAKTKDSSVLAQSPSDVMGGVAAAFAFEAAGAIKAALDNSGVTDQVKTEVVRGFKSIMSNLATAMADRATRDSEILVNAINKVNQAKTKLIAPEGKLSAAATKIQQGTPVATALQKVPIASLRQLEGSSDNAKLTKDDLISRLVTSGKSVDEIVDALNKLQVTQITAEINKLYEALNGGGTQGLKELQKSTNSPAVAKAAGAIQDPSKKSQKLGRDIADGLSLGLNPEMVSLAGVGLIASIFKAMNKEAETASPSKKAIRLGKFIVGGLKQGLTEEQLSSAAQKISKDILDGLKSGNIKEVEAAYSKMFGNLTQTLKGFDINQTIGSGDTAGIENTVSALKSLEAEVLTVGRTIAENGLGLKSTNFESTLTTLRAKVTGAMEQMGGAVTGATQQELNQILKNIDTVENRLRLLDKKSGEKALPFTKKSETISERKATLTGSGGTENIYVKAAATANTKASLTAEENQAKIQRITQALGSSMYQLGGTAGAAIAGTLEPVISVLSEAGVLSGAFNKALFGVAGVAALVTFQFLNLGRESERLNARFASIGESGPQQLRKMLTLANELGVSFQSLAETKIQIKSSLVGVSYKVDADEVTKNLATITRGFSLNKDQSDRARMGISQGFSKGTVSMEELKQQLSEAIPGFMGDFAKSMGMTVEQVMKEVAKGGVSGQQYDLAIKASAARAQPGVAAGKETLDAQVIILQNNATVLGMQLGQTALQLTKLATTGLTWVVQGFSALAPVIGTVLIGLSGGFVVALAAMTFAMLKSAAQALASSAVGSAAITAFTNPIGLWVAGISLVLVGITEIFKSNTTQLDKQLKDLANSFSETSTNIKKKVNPVDSSLAPPPTNNNLGDSLQDFFTGGLREKMSIINFANKVVGNKKDVFSQEDQLSPSQKQSNRNIYTEIGNQNQKLEAQGILSPTEVRAAAAEIGNYNNALAALRAKQTAAQQFRPNDKAAIEGIDKEIKAMEEARDAYSTAKLGANNVGRLEADIESRSAVITQLEGQTRNKQQDELLQKYKELNNQQKERLRLIQDEIALQQSILAAAYARAKAGAEDTADKNANESNIKQSALARQQATFSKTSEAFGVDDSKIKLEDAQKNAARLTTQYREMMAALDKEPQGLALLTQLGKAQLSDVTKADLAAIEALVPGVSNKESLTGLKEFAGKLGEAKNVQNELSKAGLETAQAELQAAEAAKKLLESLRDVADVMDVIKGGFEGLQVDLDVASLQRQTAIESSRNPFNEGDNTDTRLKREAIDTLGTEIDARKDFVRQILSLGNSLNDAETRFIKSFTNGVDPRDLSNQQLGQLSAQINNYKASGKPVSGNVTDYIGGLKEAGTANRDVASKELEIAKARNDMQKGVADAMKKLKDAQEKFSEALKSMLESLQDALESISDELKTLQREITDKSFDLNLQSQVQKVREAFGNGFDESFFAQIVKAGEDFYKAIRDANNKAADGQDKATKAIRDKNKEIRKIEESFQKSYKEAAKELKKAQDQLSHAQSAATIPGQAQKQYSSNPDQALEQLGAEINTTVNSGNWQAAADALKIAATRFPELAGRLKQYQDLVNRKLQAQISEQAKITKVPTVAAKPGIPTVPTPKEPDTRPFRADSVINIPGVDSTKWIKGAGDAAKQTAASLTALDSETKDTTVMYGEAQGVLAKVKESNLKFAEGQNKVAQTIGQIADLDKRKAISDLDTALRNAAKAARELAESLPLTILQLGQSIEEFGLGGRARSPGEQLAADKTSVTIQTLELGKRIDDTEKSITSLTQGKLTKDQYTTFVDKFLGNIDSLGLPRDKVEEIKSKLQGGFDNLAKLAEAIKPATELLQQKKASLPTAVYGATRGAEERYQKTLSQGKAEVASSQRSTFDAVADSPYFNGSDVSQRAKVYAELTEMQLTYAGRLKEYVDKMYALGVDSFTASELFIKAENAKKDSLRQSTNVLGLGLKSLGESSLTNLFSTLFTDVAGGAKTAGEAFLDFARSVVTGIAQMAAQMLAKFAIFQLMKAFFPGAGGAIGSAASGGGGSFLGSLLGGSFADGGTIQSYAGGGEIGKAMQREKAISGKMPRLIVAHDGEEVLSTLNQDAQTFQNLKQTGAWDSIKNNSYATGGTIGGLGSRNNSNTGSESSSTSSTTNVFITGATDEKSFRDNRSRVALTTKRRYG